MLTTTPKNPKLLAQGLAYIERAKAGGTKFVTYNCPRCGEHLETQQGNRGETWDTLCTCPYCDKMHFKITRYRTIEALVPPAETGL